MSGHRYTLRFLATALDERALRDHLESQFGATRVAITRVSAGAGVSAPRRSHASSRRLIDQRADEIVGLIAERKLCTTTELEQHFPGVVMAPIFRRLVASGRILRVRHGFYSLPGGAEPAAIEELRLRRGKAPKQAAVMEYLSSARTAREIRVNFGTTRQAVDQLATHLENKGLVRKVRLAGAGRAQFLYVRTDAEIDETALREASISAAHLQILSSLSPKAPVRPVYLAKWLRLLPQVIDVRARVLSNLGLVAAAGSGRRRTISLTETGERHPQRDPSAPKIPPEPMMMPALSVEKIKVLRLLAVLDDATTRDLTLLTGFVGPYRGYAMGQIVQRLHKYSLIESIEEVTGFPRYRLTAKGREIVTELARTEPLPDPAATSARLDGLRRDDKWHRARPIPVMRPAEPARAAS